MQSWIQSVSFRILTEKDKLYIVSASLYSWSMKERDWRVVASFSFKPIKLGGNYHEKSLNHLCRRDVFIGD